MSEQNTNASIGVSAVARAKRRDMLRRQRLAVILMAVAVAFLVAALLVVNYLVEIYVFDDENGDKYYVKKVDGVYALCYRDGEVLDRNDEGYYQTDLGTLVSVNGESGECSVYAIVHVEGTEVKGFAGNVLMFKQLTYDENSTRDKSKIIESIEVHNQHGTYTFLRDENDDFVIKGNEGAPYVKETFAQLAVACGYTLTSRRLENPLTLPDGSVDLCEYGLGEEKRIRVETDKDGNETEIEYDYSPAWYIITTKSGDSHKVIIGDKTVTGTGYYAQYEGRDTIYVIGASYVEQLTLGRVETFISPTVVYPMTVTNYFNVSDFVVYDDIDYDKIYSELSERFGEEDIGSEEFLAEYERLFATHSRKLCDFYYSPMEERRGTMYAYVPYISNLEYSDGYYLNSNNVDIILNGFYDMDLREVVKLAPSEDDLAQYGLSNAPHLVSFFYHTTDESGKDMYVENFVEISEKSEDGLYYAYSPYYNMIVSVGEGSFEFLEWDEMAWYDENYIQLSISDVENIIIESPDYSVDFHIEDSASKYLSYVAQGGNKFTVGEKEYRVIKDSESGRYILVSGDEKVSPTYVGDYLITPIVYTRAEAQAENYLFSEAKEADINGDEVTDVIVYYFYDIVNRGGEFCLVAQCIYADTAGNQISDKAETVWGQVAYSSEYFATNNGYLYFANKGSAMGAYIDETYGQKRRGVWGDGNLFVTSDNQYVLVDKSTGDWRFIDDYSCGIYFADSEDSRLAQRAVEIPEKYSSSGKLTRYSETYYPITDKKIQYNEETDKIEAYNKGKKIWETITYGDCTIGVWNTGAYYVLEGGLIIVVNSQTGEWGEANTLTTATYIADVFADGKMLDYTLAVDGVTAYSQSITAMQNFQELYRAMLMASFEGVADIDEETKKEFLSLDDFGAGSKSDNCVLKITIFGKDLKGNVRNTVYRFYRYSERRALVTVELLENDDPSTSRPENAYGSFYVLNAFAEKIITDAQRVVDGVEVKYTNKY